LGLSESGKIENYHLKRVKNMMMFMGNIIGIDVGTTGCKAILFNNKGKVLYKSYREHDLKFKENGYIELDSNLVINHIKDCIKEISSNFDSNLMLL